MCGGSSRFLRLIGGTSREVEDDVAVVPEGVVVFNGLVPIVFPPFVAHISVRFRSEVAAFVVASVDFVVLATYDTPAKPFRVGKHPSFMYLFRVVKEPSIFEWVRRLLCCWSFACDLNEVFPSCRGQFYRLVELFDCGNDISGSINSHLVGDLAPLHMCFSARPVDPAGAAATLPFIEDRSTKEKVAEAQTSVFVKAAEWANRTCRVGDEDSLPA